MSEEDKFFLMLPIAAWLIFTAIELLMNLL